MSDDVQGPTELDAGSADSAPDVVTVRDPSCSEVQGFYGCCAAEKLRYFDAAERRVVEVDCLAQGLRCGWGPGYYTCVSASGSEDPSGRWASACGTPSTSEDRCPRPCGADVECGVTPTTPICDIDTATCVGCLASQDCLRAAFGSNKLLCDTAQRRCVECLADDDCNQFGPSDKVTPLMRCNMEGRCMACFVDAHCATSGFGARCHADLPTPRCGCHSAVDCKDAAYGAICGSIGNPSWKACGCEGDMDCAEGRLCARTITAVLGRCLPPCALDSDCPGGYLCDAAASRCLPCYGTSICDLHCATDADCTVPRARGPICLPEHGDQCGCRTHADCPTVQVCRNSECIDACGSDSDCGIFAVCDTASGFCEQCLADGDCAPHGLLGCQPSNSGYYAFVCAACSKDAHCELNPNGHECIDGACRCTTDASCPPQATCEYGGCQVSSCRSDADCLPGDPICFDGGCWDGS